MRSSALLALAGAAVLSLTSCRAHVRSATTGPGAGSAAGPARVRRGEQVDPPVGEPIHRGHPAGLGGRLVTGGAPRGVLTADLIREVYGVEAEVTHDERGAHVRYLAR